MSSAIMPCFKGKNICIGINILGKLNENIDWYFGHINNGDNLSIADFITLISGKIKY